MDAELESSMGRERAVVTAWSDSEPQVIAPACGNPSETNLVWSIDLAFELKTEKEPECSTCLWTVEPKRPRLELET